MALKPTNYTNKDMLQPGARGEVFQADLPGYRDQGDRINRTNMKLAVSEHDVPNIRYELDRRLPVQFRYGFAVGYNQITIPKGRLVAVDPALSIKDFDTEKAYNALTLANGGADVKLRGSDYKNVQDKNGAVIGIGTQWAPLKADAYELTDKNEPIFRPFKAGVGVGALTGHAVAGEVTVCGKTLSGEIEVDSKTGLVKIGGTVTDEVRLGNKPIGLMERNEYTRNDNAFNGMQPGAVSTDKLVELPFFLIKEKAEQNPWGSAYGSLIPGDLVKSDENGRFIVSPLSRPDILAKMTLAEIEMERQQVVGQVYSVSRDLIPAGAAKYAQWALSDRLNFDEFNPDVWRKNGRDGEDNIDHSPYKANGGGYINNGVNTTGVPFTDDPGYPYDRTMPQNDLHMLGSTRRGYSNRMPLEYTMDQGIPGLTDGYNAVVRELGPEELGSFTKAKDDKSYRDMIFKTAEVSLESLKLHVGTEAPDEFTIINPKEVNQKIKFGSIEQGMIVKYVDLKQGMLTLAVNPEKASEVHTALEGKVAKITAQYTKRGMAGVPTFLDWDGCQGVVSILMQK